jgi:hypothetical protein
VRISRALDTADVVIGAGGDTGIDAIAIIVNGALMTDAHQVQEMLDQDGYIEASFIFIQAERSAGFDGAKIGTFGDGATDFFSGKPEMDRNDQLKQNAAIMPAIYDRSAAFRKSHLAVCTTLRRVHGMTTKSSGASWRRDCRSKKHGNV